MNSMYYSVSPKLHEEFIKAMKEYATFYPTKVLLMGKLTKHFGYTHEQAEAICNELDLKDEEKRTN